MATNKPEVLEVYRTKQGTLENVVLLADYETLQSECERLEVEYAEISENLAETELRALKFIHQCSAHVELYRELRDERDSRLPHPTENGQLPQPSIRSERADD